MRIFENYSLEDNVKFINELLVGGLSMKEIEETYYNATERSITKRLNRRGYFRRFEDSLTGIKIFALDKPKKAVTEPNKAIVEPNKTTLTKDEILKLKQLVSKYEDVMKLLDNSKSYKSDVMEAKNVQTKQFKIDNEILEQWQEFTKKNSKYKVQDLISTAMLYFMENFK